MKTKNLIADIAQICIIVIVFPLIAWMFDLDSFLDFLEGIPIFDTWLFILKNTNKIDASNIFSVIFESVVETIVMGVSVHICKKICKIVGTRGRLPILSTFVGVLIAVFLLRGANAIELLKTGIYIALIVIGIIIMITGKFRSKRLFSLIESLELVVDCLAATIVCGFVAALTLFSNGSLHITKLLTVLVLTIIALVLAAIVTKD